MKGKINSFLKINVKIVKCKSKECVDGMFNCPLDIVREKKKIITMMLTCLLLYLLLYTSL